MATTPASRGLFVVVEGLDKAGKSTQCATLVENLESQGIKVRGMRFPDRTTPIGKMIDNYLKGRVQTEDHAIHLLFSANRWEAAAQIRNHISSGTTIIIDRYHYSGSVYSAAKSIPGLNLEWARWPEVGLPSPDICIFLDISAADAQARGDFGQEKYENNEMQARVRTLFQELRDAEQDSFKVVDAGQTLDQVASEMLATVLEQISRLRDGHLEAKIRTVQPMRPRQ